MVGACGGGVWWGGCATCDCLPFYMETYVKVSSGASGASGAQVGQVGQLGYKWGTKKGFLGSRWVLGVLWGAIQAPLPR